MNTNQQKNRKARGFSLVEMLVVISVIGIIAAIGVPAIDNITGKADTNAAKRNAQSAATLHAGAVSAGAEFTATDKSGILDELVAGKAGGDVSGSQFKMSPLSARERSQALEYLAYNEATGALSYVPAGGQAAAVEAATAGSWGDWVPFGENTGLYVGESYDPVTGSYTPPTTFATEGEAMAAVEQLREEFGEMLTGYYIEARSYDDPANWADPSTPPEVLAAMTAEWEASLASEAAEMLDYTFRVEPDWGASFDPETGDFEESWRIATEPYYLF